MLFMVNPPRKKAKKRKPLSAKQKAALAKGRKALAAKRARRTTTSKPVTRRSTVARKRKSGTRRKRTAAWRKRPAAARRYKLSGPRRRKRVHRVNPPRHHRRRHHYRRNPFGGGIVGRITNGLMDGAVVTVGGVVQRTVNGFIPLASDGIMGSAKSLLAALASDYIGGMVFKGDRARVFRAGVYSQPVKQIIGMLIPGAAAYLAEYPYGSDAVGAGQVSGYVSEVGGMGEMYDGVLGAYEM